MLNVVDEVTHECLTIRVARRLKTVDVVDVLSDPFILRGVPEHVRSDNGPEFIAEVVKDWITAVGARTAYITSAVRGRAASWRASAPGCRDELLDGEIFYSLAEAKIGIERWHRGPP